MSVLRIDGDGGTGHKSYDHADQSRGDGGENLRNAQGDGSLDHMVGWVGQATYGDGDNDMFRIEGFAGIYSEGNNGDNWSGDGPL